MLRRLGHADESVTGRTWSDLDPAAVADGCTALFVPSTGAGLATGQDRFHGLVRTLRERCPWDRQQTHASLVPFLVEECFELVDALQAYDPEDAAAVAHVVEELGDVLFQVQFHAVVGEEEGRFTIADVTGGVHDKLVRRHPHVFGDVAAEDASTVVANWEDIKRAEKDRRSVLDGVPSSLPALAYTDQLMRKAAKVGFDWPDVGGPLAKLDEELAELRAAMASAGGLGDPAVGAELGDALATLVSVARHLGVDPELALREAAHRFRLRFTTVEDLAVERGLDLRRADLATLDAMWDEAKLLLARTADG